MGWSRKRIHNKPMQEWLNKNDILICSTHNEGKSVIAERFIKTLTNKIHKKLQRIIPNLILIIWMN